MCSEKMYLQWCTFRAETLSAWQKKASSTTSCTVVAFSLSSKLQHTAFVWLNYFSMDLIAVNNHINKYSERFRHTHCQNVHIAASFLQTWMLEMQYVKMVMGIAGCVRTEGKHGANNVYVALIRSFVETRQINLLAFSSKTFFLCVFKRMGPLSQIHFISFGSLLCISHFYWKKNLLLHKQVMQTNIRYFFKQRKWKWWPSILTHLFQHFVSLGQL